MNKIVKKLTDKKNRKSLWNTRFTNKVAGRPAELGGLGGSALKMRLKELTGNNINLNVIENAIVEDAPIDEKIEKADSPAEGKKKETL